MTSDDKTGYDVEYQYSGSGEKHRSVFAPDESGAVHGETFVTGDTFYHRLQRFAGRYGVEQRGIERVPEDERTDKSTLKVGTMWLAANMVISSFAIGVLAVPVFALGFIDGILVIIFVNMLGILPVCFFSTFGPRFGMRQMILSRFWFGYWGVKVIAIFNCLACLGWSSVNVIVGAQLLHAVNPSVPGWAGIIVIAACTFLVTLFGYKVVHMYEMISWVPCFIIFLIVLGEFAHSGSFSNLSMGSGAAETGSVLSFAASVFGFATGWTSYASDYTCYQPATTPRKKVFLYVFIGLIFPLWFTEMLGLAVATAIVNDKAFADAYDRDAVGGLLHQVLVPPLGGFGKFCLVVLALSIVGNNCPNIYSLTFSLQILTRYAQKVPRFLWTLVGSVIYCAIAIPGYSHFESVLENFMLVIGYWLAVYSGIALPEHFFFKRGFRGYTPSHYDQPNRLPPSIAALGAFCFGVFGAVMGMAQVWFIGPIGKRIGDPSYGGDVGFELAFGFAFVAYVCFRPLEVRYFRR
ncbi:Purine-cytosine permease fcy21 [Exophiala dermatitidis]|uniref:Purine-cytosine permease fcy21 n=1 Tax=Exophiala dermatitidis TaxID=5970 RepID=A0AAN6EX61_EXODE|nr:Purine-cytosine permease fcy21 [Exophiala dermatitidis]KAJ4505584.1 Purine-cytosine permease fcy21 [Exophiala dermatitidis]KAJ4506052.1 Purine-cytosine permease fcy21 [Exophiala dermatitidis]KAJ4536570.1 Purine-cytosine permease fcy21 [Exophiala dermatitidis]KAJ4555824.1 Purine-cytosine permease fcy21 [Exophiala dermatitidis]